jgi:hypothetical protein
MTRVTDALRLGSSPGFLGYEYVNRLGFITNTSKGLFTWSGAFITGFTLGFDVGKFVRSNVGSENL